MASFKDFGSDTSFKERKGNFTSNNDKAAFSANEEVFHSGSLSAATPSAHTPVPSSDISGTSPRVNFDTISQPDVSFPREEAHPLYSTGSQSKTAVVPGNIVNSGRRTETNINSGKSDRFTEERLSSGNGRDVSARSEDYRGGHSTDKKKASAVSSVDKKFNSDRGAEKRFNSEKSDRFTEEKFTAGGGGTARFEYSKDGKMIAKVCLSQDRKRNDRGGISKLGREFERFKDDTDLLKPEHEENAIADADAKIQKISALSMKKHRDRARRYGAVKSSAARNIKRIKKEEKREAARSEKLDGLFNSLGSKFSDSDSLFISSIDGKFKGGRDPFASENMLSVSGSGVAALAVPFASWNRVRQKKIKETYDAKNSSVWNDSKGNAARKASSNEKTRGDSEARTVAGNLAYSGYQESIEKDNSLKKGASKAKSKEVRRLAAATAVNRTFEIKKNLSNMLGDVNGSRNTGDYMVDGSAGLINLIIQHSKEVVIRTVRDIAVAFVNFLKNLITPFIPFLLCLVAAIFFIMMFIFIISGSTNISIGDSGLGSEYHMDVNGDGYVYSSLSDEEINNIISALSADYQGVSAEQLNSVYYALTKVGCAYDQGSHFDHSDNVFDCSELVYCSYLSTGIDISYSGLFSAAEECRNFVYNNRLVEGDMNPGDLIFYGGSGNGRFMGVYHVAIYVGRVNGVDKMVEARGTNYGVVYCDVRSNKVVAVGRPV